MGKLKLVPSDIRKGKGGTDVVVMKYREQPRICRTCKKEPTINSTKPECVKCDSQRLEMQHRLKRAGVTKK